MDQDVRGAMLGGQAANNQYSPFDQHVAVQRRLAQERVSPGLVFTPEERGFTFRETTGGLGLLSKCWAFSTIDEATEWLNARHKTEGEE